MSNTPLYRAVNAAELQDIEAPGRFRNPAEVASKYFSLSYDGARRYAALATSGFGEGPFWMVSTAIPTRLVTWQHEATVDRGIEALAVPTALLRLLSPPVIEGPL